MRHLRRARRRQAGALVPRARARVRGPPRRDGRGDGRAGRPPSAAEGLRRPRRGAVRLLHAGIPADGEGAARGEPETDAAADPRSARREPLPLHRLHQDLRSRRARRRLDARRRRRAAQGDPVRVSTSTRVRAVCPVRPKIADGGARRVDPRRRASLHQGGRRGEGHRPDEVRRRRDAAADAPLQAPALEDRPRADPLASTSRRPWRRPASSRSRRGRICRRPSGSFRSRRTSTRCAPTASASSATRSPRSRRWTRTRPSTRWTSSPWTTSRCLRSARSTTASRRPSTPIHDYGDQANIHKLVSMEFGDTEQGFARADRVYEDLFFYEGNTHLPLEQHAAVADFGPDGKLTLWSSTQTPHYVHRALAKVLEMPPAKIRVIATPNGGGFGGKSDPVQPRDRRRPPLARHGSARQDLPHARGGLLLPPRAPPDAHEGADGREEGRRDHGDALPDRARRRRLRLLRRRLDVLHGRAADRDLPGADVPLRRRARLHQQAAVRPQARPRHAPAALRPGGPARQDRVRPRHRPGGDPPPPPPSGEHADRELPARRLDRPRRLHRQGRRRLGLEEAAREASARARARNRLLVVPLRRGAADLLEHDAAVRRPAEARPRRRRHRLLRLDGHRPGLRLDPGLDRGGGPGHRSLRHPHRHRRHGPDAGGPRLLLLARDADDRQRRDPGGRAREGDARRDGGEEARDPAGARGLRRRARLRRRRTPRRA